jgi:16S rRNA (adenine1518-N6/adenine1519-N6)-dimethyltransferase
MRQKFGQNFLTDKNIARNIVEAAGLEKGDEVIEIGPGKGILTQLIAPAVSRLTVIEIDRTLFEKLKISQNGDNIEFINKDVLDFDFPQDKPFKLISNLPYNIGTAVIQRILPQKGWTNAIFMLQKEVAQRICGKVGTKNYGFLSIFCSYFANIEMLFDVSAHCFYPQPKITSSVLKFTNRNPQKPDPLFFELIKFCFSMRRKAIINSITYFMGVDKYKCAEILKLCSIDPLIRPDKLTINNFFELTSIVKTYNIHISINNIVH